MAVIFVTKMENGEKSTKGLCLKCAKEMGVPVDNLVGNVMGQFGISPEQLEGAEDDINAMLANTETPSDADDTEERHIKGEQREEKKENQASQKQQSTDEKIDFLHFLQKTIGDDETDMTEDEGSRTDDEIVADSVMPEKGERMLPPHCLQ
jgi:hypothetical protein